MLPLNFCLFIALVFFASAEKISFENVTVHGYSAFTHKFKKNVSSSNSLKLEIPKAVFDAIEIKGLVPVLYEGSIDDIDQLDELIMEENGIEEIRPGAMVNLPNIRIIKLKGNKLEKIENGVFNKLPVSDIDLRNNQISVIEENAFDDMQSLLNVKLSDNRISKWNKNWFSNTPLLTRLSIQHNLIEELPSEAFQNMKGVKKFGRVPLLINFIFSYNKIKVVHPDAFKGLKEINSLWLDNNLIENLPENFLDGISVKDLRLSSNKIVCIENKDSVLKADMNDIDANPLDCVCLENIKTWAKENNKSVSYFYSDMNCYTNRLQKKIKDINVLLKNMKNGGTDDEAEMITEKVSIK